MLKPAAILAAAVVSALVAAQSIIALDRRVEATPEPALTRVAVATDAAAVTKGADGHFWAEAKVNGRRVRFLVDTGATTVALTADDAFRLGLKASELDFRHPVSTAAGKTKAALVELDYVSVAGAKVEKVQALVMEEGLETSLLGMSYLGRLSRFEATRDSLILRP
ncbi:MAG TPA: TIGR02281 family clan AA aspartic protease [Caulobacteraceae bacterium]|nr:TIGR02281 family clan AA aspartic protease [Caulobacteraceae bacterium]